MIKFENLVLPSPEQWKAIIRGMRNPMNSWDKSDSYSTHVESKRFENEADFQFFLGDADHDLMQKLADAGSVHAKYRRMIPVYVDIVAPLYWWKEFDTYKVGTVANSCSTMHKIHAKEFEMGDFSIEHLINDISEHHLPSSDISDVADYLECHKMVLAVLNIAREWYLETKDETYWHQMIQLLPSSYNQRRTVMLNYETLANIYKHRKDHKLDEWRELCTWIKELPYSDLITG